MALSDFCGKASMRASDAAKRFGVEHLILNAPMPGAATPMMTAAVSEAGGLGVLAAQRLDPDEIESAGRAVAALTGRPFAVALEVPPRKAPDIASAMTLFDGLTPLLADLSLPTDPKHYGICEDVDREARFKAQFEAALALKPSAMLSTCGGFRECYAEALEASGILNVGVATTLREAKVLRAAAVDAVVVQGAEAGGQRSNFEDPASAGVGAALLTSMAAQATGLPVVSAGGIASAELAAGLLAAGASGVMLGTALLSTEESALKEQARQAAQWAGASDTTTTRLFTGRLSRVLKCPLVESLRDYEAYAADWPLPAALFDAIESRARLLGREELLVLPAGQGLGRSRWMTAGEAVRAVAAAF